MKVFIMKLNYSWDIVEVDNADQFIKQLKKYVGHLVRRVKVVGDNERVTAKANDYLPTLAIKSDDIYYTHIPAFNLLLD